MATPSCPDSDWRGTPSFSASDLDAPACPSEGGSGSASADVTDVTPTVPGTDVVHVEEVCVSYASALSVSGDAVLTDAVSDVEVDASGGDVEVTLPPVLEGSEFSVYRSDASGNVVTVVPSGSETINGAASYEIVGQWSGVIFRSRPGVSGWVAYDGAVSSVSGTSGQIDVASPTTNPVLSLPAAQSGVHTWADVQTFTVAPVFSDQSGTRTALGLGTAAVQNTGTSGATVPLLNGANTWSSLQTITITDAVTSTTSNALAIYHNSSGTPAAGFGIDIHWYLKTSTTDGQAAALQTVEWVDATHGSRRARVLHRVSDSASSRVYIEGSTSGSAPKIGFLDAASAVRQTGDAGTALVTFGLMSGTPTFAAANLTGTIASTNLPGGDWITATKDETTGSYTISASSGTYAATGISVSLPAAGTYLVVASVRGEVQPATTGSHHIVCKFYNATDAADVTNSERMIVLSNQNGVLVTGTSMMCSFVTVAASKTIEIYAKRTGTSFTSSQLLNDTNGRTWIAYLRIY